jgi:hypothetical protein
MGSRARRPPQDVDGAVAGGHRPQFSAEAVTTLLGDAPERERLRIAGLARAAGFSWDRTARAVDAVVQERGLTPFLHAG